MYKELPTHTTTTKKEVKIQKKSVWEERKKNISSHRQKITKIDYTFIRYRKKNIIINIGRLEVLLGAFWAWFGVDDQKKKEHLVNFVNRILFKKIFCCCRYIGVLYFEESSLRQRRKCFGFVRLRQTKKNKKKNEEVHTYSHLYIEN